MMTGGDGDLGLGREGTEDHVRGIGITDQDQNQGIEIEGKGIFDLAI